MAEGPGYNIPIWIRITWAEFTPDPEQMFYNERTPHGKKHGSPVKWGRNRPTVPDRWIYHLFMAKKSNIEIAKRLGLTPQHVAWRINKLTEAHWITKEMRKAKQIAVAAKRRKQPYTMKQPRFKRTRKIWTQVGYWMNKRKTITVSELVAITGGSTGTVTRYASIWRERLDED